MGKLRTRMGNMSIRTPPSLPIFWGRFAFSKLLQQKETLNLMALLHWKTATVAGTEAFARSAIIAKHRLESAKKEINMMDMVTWKVSCVADGSVCFLD